MKNFLIRAAAILVMAGYYLGTFGVSVARRYTFFGFTSDYWLWFSVLLFLNNGTLFAKSSRLIYINMVFLFVSATLFWMDYSDPFFLLSYHLLMLYSITLYEQFAFNRDSRGMDLVIKSAFFFIFVSCVSGILIYAITGLSPRIMYAQMRPRGIRASSLIELFGDSGITFYYGISLIIPALVACIKSHPRWGVAKISLTVVLVIIILALLISEYAAAMLLGVIGLVVALIGRRRLKVSLALLGALILLIIFLPNIYKVAFFGQLAEMSPGETMSARIGDVGLTLEEGVGRTETHTSRRASRIPYQLSNFIRSPLIGTGINTEHNFWIDILSRFGIFGLFPIFLVYRRQFVRNFAYFDESFRFYYLVTLLIFVAMGVMKNMSGIHFTLAFLFIVPGLYHTDLYYKRTS